MILEYLECNAVTCEYIYKRATVICECTLKQTKTMIWSFFYYWQMHVYVQKIRIRKQNSASMLLVICDFKMTLYHHFLICEIKGFSFILKLEPAK